MKSAKKTTKEPKTTMKGELLRTAILDAAAKLFIERGTGGTSIQDIAESLGLTRTAVYYYFKKKEDILQSLTEEVTLSAERIASLVVERRDLDPVTALHDLVKQHAALVLARPAEFRVVERNENDLAPEYRVAAQTARRSLLQNFRDVIERGIQTGDFRMVDARVAAFSLIGMCNWTAWWFNAEGPLSQEQVADSIADLAVNSIKRIDARRPATPDVKESLRLLREDLAYLETVLQMKPD